VPACRLAAGTLRIFFAHNDLRFDRHTRATPRCWGPFAAPPSVVSTADDMSFLIFVDVTRYEPETYVDYSCSTTVVVTHFAGRLAGSKARRVAEQHQIEAAVESVPASELGCALSSGPTARWW
jgi:hypothetical protein